MKTIAKILLVLSALGNVALAVLIWHGAGAAAVPDAPEGGATAQSAGAAAKATPAADPVWSKVKSDDLPSLVQRLRDAGFPPSIIRAILAAQIRDQFAARRKAIEGDTNDTAFWKNPVIDVSKQKALREIAREERDLLRKLLGPDADAGDTFGQMYRDRGLANIPAAKVDDVRQILRDYDEQRQELYSNISVGGVITMTAADMAKVRAIDAAQHADLAKILTPEELELYDLSASRTAQSLRYQLSAFNPTEDEFRALFKLQQAFDDTYGNMLPSSSPDEMRARMEAQKQLKADMKSALSPDRAAVLDRATDYNYRQTTQLVARLELPPETADQLYTVQKEFEQRRTGVMQQVREDMTAAAQSGERPNFQKMYNDRLTALQQEAIAKVTPLLGSDRALDAYKQYGGSWISNMVPRLPPPPPSSGTVHVAPGT